MTNINWDEFSFKSARGPMLRGKLSSPPARGAPIVMMVTGDGKSGSKSATWANLPPMLHERGLRTFLFDFQGLGDSPGERSKLNCTIAIENLSAAYKALRKREPRPQLGILAASFGATALICSPGIANKATRIALKSPATILSLAYLGELSEQEFNGWAANKHSEANGYDFSVFKDACKYNALGIAPQIKTPTLITHGDRDEIVSFDQSIALAANWGGPARLERFEGGGHGYSEPGAWDRMAKLYADWFAPLVSGR